jgi:hypothetical protein
MFDRRDNISTSKAATDPVIRQKYGVVILDKWCTLSVYEVHGNCMKIYQCKDYKQELHSLMKLKSMSWFLP